MGLNEVIVTPLVRTVYNSCPLIVPLQLTDKSGDLGFAVKYLKNTTYLEKTTPRRAIEVSDIYGLPDILAAMLFLGNADLHEGNVLCDKFRTNIGAQNVRMLRCIDMGIVGRSKITDSHDAGLFIRVIRFCLGEKRFGPIPCYMEQFNEVLRRTLERLSVDGEIQKGIDKELLESKLADGVHLLIQCVNDRHRVEAPTNMQDKCGTLEQYIHHAKEATGYDLKGMTTRLIQTWSLNYQSSCELLQISEKLEKELQGQVTKGHDDRHVRGRWISKLLGKLKDHEISRDKVSVNLDVDNVKQISKEAGSDVGI